MVRIITPEEVGIESNYPYTPDGSASSPCRGPWPDPFVLLTATGVHTQTIQLGVQEMVLFMTALDTETRLAQLEEAANAFMS